MAINIKENIVMAQGLFILWNKIKYKSLFVPTVLLCSLVWCTLAQGQNLGTHAGEEELNPSELPTDRKQVKTSPGFTWNPLSQANGQKEGADKGWESDQQSTTGMGTSLVPVIQDPILKPTVPCDIPHGVDILHIPVSSWTDSDWFTKKKQEILHTVEDKAQDAFHFITGTVNQWINGEKMTPAKKDEEDTFLPVVSEIVEKRAYAHFVLAQIIQQNPQSAVFHEWTTQLMDNRRLDYFKYTFEIADGVKEPEQIKENPTMKSLFQVVNSQFSDGFPPSFHALTKGQKETLSILGGVWTLFFLYELPVIFPALSERDYQTIFFDIADMHHMDLERCGYNNMTIICSNIINIVHNNFQLRAFKASTLARRVRNFRSLFPSPLAELNQRVGPAEPISRVLPLEQGNDATLEGFLATPTRVGDETNTFQAHQKPSVILAYADYSESFEPDDKINSLNKEPFKVLSSYWSSSDHFYSLPKECLFPPTKLEP